MIILVILALAFLCGMLLVLALIGQDSDRARLDQRLDLVARATYVEEGPSLSDAELNKSFRERILVPTMQNLGQFLMKFTPSGTEETTRAALIRAGNPKGIDVLQYLCLRALSCIVFVFVGIGVQQFAAGVMMKLVVFIFSVVIGLVLPDSLLQRAITQRQETIRKGLPDTIDLLIVSVEAGTGFDGAMQKVAEKVTGPIGLEFERALKEMRLGKQRAKALKDMAQRVGLGELSTFVAALNQSEQLGVSIANVLRVQSETIRVARIQRIREAAAKLPVKMLFPLVFFIFPAIFLVMLGPGMIGIAKMFSSM